LHRTQTPVVLTWLHRFFPSVPVKPTVSQGLWVCRAGTPQVREVGHIPMSTKNFNTITGDPIEQVEMLPDGRQISFIYRNVLYVVPLKTSE
jgi:hypothetical protein